REPRDVARARAGVASAAIFLWPCAARTTGRPSRYRGTRAAGTVPGPYERFATPAPSARHEADHAHLRHVDRRLGRLGRRRHRLALHGVRRRRGGDRPRPLRGPAGDAWDPVGGGVSGTASVAPPGAEPVGAGPVV